MNSKRFKNLGSVLLEMDTNAKMDSFLKAILTPKEVEEIPVRLEIVRRLLNGESQHQIAKALGVGVATVTRGAREIKLGNFDVLKKIWRESSSRKGS